MLRHIQLKLEQLKPKTRDLVIRLLRSYAIILEDSPCVLGRLAELVPSPTDPLDPHDISVLQTMDRVVDLWCLLTGMVLHHGTAEQRALLHKALGPLVVDSALVENVPLIELAALCGAIIYQ